MKLYMFLKIGDEHESGISSYLSVSQDCVLVEKRFFCVIGGSGGRMVTNLAIVWVSTVRYWVHLAYILGEWRTTIELWFGSNEGVWP